MRNFLLAILSLGLAVPAVAQTSAWAPMQHAVPSANPLPASQRMAQPVVDLWKKVVPGQDVNGMLYQTYKDGDMTITVMIGLEDGCDMGPSTSTSERHPATCPLHVVVGGAKESKAYKFDGACYIHVDPTVEPTDPDPRYNGTFTTYDADKKVLTLQTLIGNKLDPNCSKSYSFK